MADKELKYCIMCGEAIIGHVNRNRMYCSNKCNQKAHREKIKLVISEITQGKEKQIQLIKSVADKNEEIQRLTFSAKKVEKENVTKKIQETEIIKKSNEKIEALLNPVIINLSNDTGKDLSECARQDKKHLYEPQDLWILLAKILRVALSKGYSDFNSMCYVDAEKRRLINDFEHRFKCNFRDVQKANEDIKPFDTTIQNEWIVYQYANLPYSK